MLNPTETTGGAFLTELNSTGKKLLFSTYFGGSAVFGGQFPTASLAVDSENSVYVTGTTGGGFTVAPNAFQGSMAGFNAAFVTKIATLAADVQVTNTANATVKDRRRAYLHHHGRQQWTRYRNRSRSDRCGTGRSHIRQRFHQRGHV